MEKLRDKIEKIWSGLLNQKSKNYLLRSKIDQSIAVTNSNLSASFLGNRQMANHNTEDIKYCLQLDKSSQIPVFRDGYLERLNVEANIEA